MDLSNIMQMAQQLKDKMENAQAEARHVEVTGEAGGGMVKVVLTGHHECKTVTIDPQLFKGDDVALVEDLVRAAMNHASSKLADELKSRMGNLASSSGVDLSALGLDNFPK